MNFIPTTEFIHGPSTLLKKAKRLKELFGSDTETEEIEAKAAQQIIDEINKDLSESESETTTSSSSSSSESSTDSDNNSNETDRETKSNEDVLEINIDSSSLIDQLEKTIEIKNNLIEKLLHEPLKKNVENDSSLRLEKENILVEKSEEIISLLKYPLILSPIKKQSFKYRSFTLSSSPSKTKSLDGKTKSLSLSHSQTKPINSRKREHAQPDNSIKSAVPQKRRLASVIVRPKTTNDHSTKVKQSFEQAPHTHSVSKHSTNTYKNHRNNTNATKRTNTTTKHRTNTSKEHRKRDTHTNNDHRTNTRAAQQLTPAKTSTNTIALHYSAETSKPETIETERTETIGTRIISLNNKYVPEGVRLAIAVDKNKQLSKNALKKLTRNLLSEY